MLPNPYLILGVVLAFLLSNATVGYLMYERGKDDMKAAYTEQQLEQANKNLKDATTNNKIANDAGLDHEGKVQTIHDQTTIIHDTVHIPASADVFLPVGFVRMFDRAASRNPAADPYPGKSDGDPSDVKVSEAQSLLNDNWADQYYACRQQVIDTAKLNPVLPAPPDAKQSGLFDHLNPFN